MSCIAQRPAARDAGGRFSGPVVRSSGSCGGQHAAGAARADGNKSETGEPLRGGFFVG
ncbi:MAG: hypothetical protein ACOX1G_07825 [bacterium]